MYRLGLLVPRPTLVARVFVRLSRRCLTIRNNKTQRWVHKTVPYWQRINCLSFSVSALLHRPIVGGCVLSRKRLPVLPRRRANFTIMSVPASASYTEGGPPAPLVSLDGAPSASLAGPHSSSIPAPAAFQTNIFVAGIKYVRPALSTSPHAWEPAAKDVLSSEAWGYLYGSAGTRETLEKNLAALRRWSIVPLRLHGAGLPNLETTMFKGSKYETVLPFPLALAPVGVQKLFHREGEQASAAAAAKACIPYTHSTAASTSIEDAAAANGSGARFFQLYRPPNEFNDMTISFLRRAKASGYTALLVTLDTYTIGYRPMDLDKGYNPFLRADWQGVANGLCDPVFQQRFAQLSGGKTVDEDLQNACLLLTQAIWPGAPPNHSWGDLAFLREHWDGPIVLKGIQSVSDARRAVEAGMDGIVVSNHGGRQQDGAVGALTMLPHICSAVGDQIDVYFDSGVRCGADVVKALALGAKLVFVGRPYVYGLALGGEEGVSHVLKCLLAETALTMQLAGMRDVEELRRKNDHDWVVREDQL